ncbi:hypothetical protein [Tateyamaria sp.]|uniref:hypothetical protein n=1 Tax=Tateyamaria sp. TaxID=1929288 RepID=UPI00329D979E
MNRNAFYRGGLAICLAAQLAFGAAQAGTPVVYEDDGRALFKLEVPDFWTLRTGGLRDLEGPDADDIRDVSRVFGMTADAHPGVWVGVISPHGVSNFDDAREYLQDIGPFLVQEAEAEAPKSRQVGGLPARSIAGTGRRDGKNVTFTALAIDLPSNRMVIAVVVLEAGVDQEPITDINRMLASIRSIR